MTAFPIGNNTPTTAAPPAGYTKKAPATAAPPAGYTKNAPPAGYTRKAAPPEEDYGPFGLGDNFARAGQTLDDTARIAVDTVSRGYVDKWLGPEEEAKTAAARERQGWGGTAVDLTSTLASMPYRVGGSLAGGTAGAVEGALRSYGNQEGWVPEWGNIAQDTATSALLGAGGAKLPAAWNAGKDVLKKFGNVPKWKTAIFDYLIPGMPLATGASTTAKVVSAVTPKLPTGPITRDVLAKTMMTMGGRQAE